MSHSVLRNFLLVAVVFVATNAVGIHPSLASEATGQELLNDASSGRDWAGYGRTYGQQHYSPLSAISQGNLSSLGLAWFMDLPAENSVTEPIAVNGVLYFATGLSKVNAVDAVTGKLLWQYDPKVGEVGGLNLRNGWGVRGVAWWQDKIYVGTQDGRLIALDAKSGQLLWNKQTIEPDMPAHVNGAPRVFNGRVLIGFAGTTGAVRGYVTAYDAQSGEQLWRFWTVPGNPADGFENEAMAMAAKTWSGEWWKVGGGATVWNSMAYDSETDTVFIGTGSGYPWNHRLRSEGKGDNLFVSSIVALNGATGAYQWHYQTTPGETWDYDSTMDIELADIEIDGKLRKTVMQAPKNGFFYVLDRITGELISAEPYTEVSWASRVDRRTGRPVEMPDARFKNGKAVRIKPGTMGAHNWMPMAYSPDTQLIYLPVVDIEMEFNDINYDWQPAKDRSVDGGLALAAGPYGGLKPASGQLLAWSPAEQKAVWKVEQPTYLNGGVLATGGKLVFQGTIDGIFKAYDAGSGKVLWQFDAKAPILAAPISYEVEGTQYITVLTGSGMAFPIYAGMMLGEMVEKFGIDPRSQDRRVLTFALGGNTTLPARRSPPPPVEDDDFVVDPAMSTAGMAAFFSHCTTCHGAMAVGMGNGPDLRRSAMILDETLFDQVVRSGLLESRGMPRFAEFDKAKVASIRHYLRDQARRLRVGDTGQSPSPGKAGM